MLLIIDILLYRHNHVHEYIVAIFEKLFLDQKKEENN